MSKQPLSIPHWPRFPSIRKLQENVVWTNHLHDLKVTRAQQTGLEEPGDKFFRTGITLHIFHWPERSHKAQATTNEAQKCRGQMGIWWLNSLCYRNDVKLNLWPVFLTLLLLDGYRNRNLTVMITGVIVIL